MQMMCDVRAVDPASALRHAMDLTEAYDLSEHAHPDLVLLDHTLIDAPNMSMFLSMLSALAIDWIVVFDDTPADHVPLDHQIRIDQISAFLAGEWKTAKSKHRPKPVPAAAKPQHKADAARPRRRWKTVVVGASTGGIEALIALLSQYPTDAPPTVIVQHINATFVTGLAARLDRLCRPRVRVAESGDRLKPGHIFLAQGDTHHLVIAGDGETLAYDPAPPRKGHRPSVDTLFSSAARVIGAQTVGVLLSGMGSDGATGLSEIRQTGGWTIAQDQSTSVVYGMPRVAAEQGAVIDQVPQYKLGDAVLNAALIAQERRHNA